MKPLFILFVSVTLITGNGCKKDKQEDNPDVNPPTEKKVVVTTVAGSTEGFTDGPLLSAKFRLPADVLVAPDGTIYVTDLFNSRIRKITGGQVSTFAGGTTTLGIVNGNGPLARFIDPTGIAMDATGNLYTSDGSDPRIRKISPVADVSTYAGIATPGFNDGSADAAQFNKNRWGIVADVQGNIYLADAGNNRIRKISISGQVTTIAGSGIAGFKDDNGTEAQFFNPGGIAFDQQGNLYVLDIGNFRIRKITPSGQVSTFAGSGIKGNADGNAGTAQFFEMFDMVIDKQGNLYVTDNHRIRKISPQGVVSALAGSTVGYADGDGLSAKFHYASGLAIDAQDNIYVADAFNSRIRKISFE